MEPVTEELVYRRVGVVDLAAYLVRPVGAAGPRPAVVHFHGGSWRSGHPLSFLPHCHHLARRGVVAASVSYRLIGSTASGIQDCVADAHAAVRWVRSLDGVRPDRVAAAGFSAGGHLAASTATLAPADRDRTSSRPDAVILLNPVVQAVRPGDYAVIEAVSPIAHVVPGLPPSVVVYGTRDPWRTLTLRYAEALGVAGNRCDLVALDGAHTVVLPPVRRGEAYASALQPVDNFLVSLGWINDHVDVAAVVDTIDWPAVLKGGSEKRHPGRDRARR